MAYVTPFLATTNAVISSADCNAGYRGNIMRLREMLPDPGAAGRLLRSLGSGSAATAAWVATCGHRPQPGREQAENPSLGLPE